MQSEDVAMKCPFCQSEIEIIGKPRYPERENEFYKHFSTRARRILIKLNIRNETELSFMDIHTFLITRSAGIKTLCELWTYLGTLGWNFRGYNATCQEDFIVELYKKNSQFDCLRKVANNIAKSKISQSGRA
jgi:hypothetical protein